MPCRSAIELMGSRMRRAPAFLATRMTSSRLEMGSSVPEILRMPGMTRLGMTGRFAAAEHSPMNSASDSSLDSPLFWMSLQYSR